MPKSLKDHLQATRSFTVNFTARPAAICHAMCGGCSHPTWRLAASSVYQEEITTVHSCALHFEEAMQLISDAIDKVSLSILVDQNPPFDECETAPDWEPTNPPPQSRDIEEYDESLRPHLVRFGYSPAKEPKP